MRVIGEASNVRGNMRRLLVIALAGVLLGTSCSKGVQTVELELDRTIGSEVRNEASVSEVITFLKNHGIRYLPYTEDLRYEEDISEMPEAQRSRIKGVLFARVDNV